MSRPIRTDSPEIPDDHAAPSPSPTPDHAARRPIRCDCGRALIVKVDRDRVILRCPVHGVQFRYTVRDLTP